MLGLPFHALLEKSVGDFIECLELDSEQGMVEGSQLTILAPQREPPIARDIFSLEETFPL
jgi:hypothetical protein